MVYVYTAISYLFFYKKLGEYCYSMRICYLFIFDTLFKSDGAIGGYISNIDDENPEYKVNYTFGRFLYDSLGNYLLVIIIVSIVSGVIVDTFGS